MGLARLGFPNALPRDAAPGGAPRAEQYAPRLSRSALAFPCAVVLAAEEGAGAILQLLASRLSVPPLARLAGTSLQGRLSAGHGVG